MKILFLVKQNGSYGETTTTSKAGLRNSARFVVDAINKFGDICAELKILQDQNRIDAEIHKFKPNMVILEAVWVTPEKLRELIGLHPTIRFVIRIHSRVPFLAMEGNAIKWIKEYVKIASVSFNHFETSEDFDRLGFGNIYLPNIYPDITYKPIPQHHKKHLYKIGCFGAIRPFKNQLAQAMAAILFAEKVGGIVHFYINSTRIEQRGESVLKSLQALFEGGRHRLVEIPWLEHDEFLKVVQEMDACMQVSFTETFNIVTADCISQHVPVVVSDAISWLKHRKANPNSEGQMAEILEYTIANKHELVEDAIHDLAAYNHHAILKWFRFLKR